MLDIMNSVKGLREVKTMGRLFLKATWVMSSAFLMERISIIILAAACGIMVTSACICIWTVQAPECDTAQQQGMQCAFS